MGGVGGGSSGLGFGKVMPRGADSSRSAPEEDMLDKFVFDSA